MVKAAKESNQVERARKKIQEKFTEENEQVTPTTINEAINSMHYWIHRHQSDRISLKKKNIAHNADVKSKYVLHLMQQLQGKIPSKKTTGKLKGRIKMG